MKKTRLVLASILAVIFLLSIAVCAFAEEAQYDATKKYIEAMAELGGATCMPGGLTEAEETNYEILKVDYAGELSNYTSHFYVLFSEAGDSILMVMPILNFDENRLDEVIKKINQLNGSTTKVKLYADEKNNVVMAEMSLLVTPETPVDLSMKATGIFIGFTDGILEAMKDFVKTE